MNFSFKNSILLPFLQASHPAHVPPVQWSCLAGIRSGILPARCGNEARGLVDHERSALQFSCCWGLCVSGGSLNELPEPAGADSSQVICRSWNRGRCSAQFASCRFAHRCSTCAGSHRASDAPVVLTKRRHTIANADRLLLPPCPRPLRKPGVNGCTLFVFLIVFLPCFVICVDCL